MNIDIRNWARSCLQCQRSKIRHTATPLSTFATPDARFDKIHIDIVGPLPPSHGFSYILTCIDRFTRWPEAIPLADITAETVARAFTSGWVARFGIPSTVSTDRGRQFESTLWMQLMYLLGCKRIRTTSYHPIANGIIERFHRQLKASLKAQRSPNHWVESLPLVLLGINDMQCSAAELVYGTTLRLPVNFSVTVRINLNWTPSHMLLASSQPCRHFGQHRFAINRNKECMYVKSSHHVHMCLFATMQFVSHCSSRIMDHTKYFNALQNISRYQWPTQHCLIRSSQTSTHMENSKCTDCEILHPKPDESNASTPRITR